MIFCSITKKVGRAPPTKVSAGMALQGALEEHQEPQKLFVGGARPTFFVIQTCIVGMQHM